MAAAITRISALTAKLSTVLGTVTVTTASSTAALNMDKLTYVKTSLEIIGKMPTVAALATTGALTLNTDDASYSIPTLLSAGLISIDVSSAVSVTSIQLANVTTTDNASTNAAGNQFVAIDADVNLGKAGLPATVTVKSLTGGGATYNSGTISTTGGDVNLSAATVSNSTIKAIGNISLTGATSIENSTITSSGNITAAQVTLAGAVTMTAGTGGSLILSGATSIGPNAGLASATLSAPGGSVNLTALKDHKGVLNITSNSVDLSAMTSNTGALTLSASITSLSLPAMTNNTGTIVGSGVTNISAPALTLTVTNSINVAAGSTHSYLAMDETNGSRTLVASDVSVLTLGNQAKSLDFAGAPSSDWKSLTTLTITGKANASPASQANAISVGSNNASLTIVTMVGNSWLSAFTSNNSPMTSLTTAGRIRAFNVSGTALTALTFNHVEVTPGDASSIDIANTKIQSLDMSNSAIKTDYIYISDNASLTTVTMPSSANLAEPSASISITIHDNALTGAWTAAVAATGTTPYSEGSFVSTVTVGIVGLSNYVTAYTGQTARTGTVSYTVEIDAASAAMTTNQGVSTILGDAAVAHYKVGGSSIADGVEVINTAAELGLLGN